MILIFGGTTEGRKAAEVLEESGNRYYYSTKTGEQELTLRHGVRIDGALDRKGMCSFCLAHQIRLIVDAAHPFALQLHKTIDEASAELRIPVVRYERIYPPREEDITWIDDYADLPHLPLTSLLATTGVQSIHRLKALEAKGVKVWYRILRRDSSLQLAFEQGARPDQLCFYEDGHTIDVDAEAILLKESGRSGGFCEKVEAARRKGMRIIAIKRPVLPFTHCVDGPHGLRRMIEQLLPSFFPLKSGLTTGTCATAATIAATKRLLWGETPSQVGVLLPDGETISVAVTYDRRHAACRKEAGDDPDVTNGITILAEVEPSDHFEICGGTGVGRFTLPGFDYPVGEAAINKGPREMICRNIEALTQQPLRVTISVPKGEDIAKRTFNPRLGIEGGISIIGVSGIVKPFSEEAFIQSIRKCMEVAVASQPDRIVINSGGKSERFVKSLYPTLPHQAFVEYGNYIGETIRMAAELGVERLTLGVMMGKAVKLAAGHLDTHSRRVTMDKPFVASMLSEAGITLDLTPVTLARELWTLVPKEKIQQMADVIISHCYKVCQPLFPDGKLTVLLISDEGEIYSLSTRSVSD